ncbi:MAG TPA: TonB-dependent receptor [Gemmatimonadaceae bacterium]|nr:TonB-dependent receptor [Gemmatimonadaceae bacterium]
MSSSSNPPVANRRNVAAVVMALLAATTAVAAVGGVALLVPVPLAAQDVSGYGRISGTVTDETHAPIVGAQVSVPGTGLGATTNDAGHYTLARLSPGRYEIRVQRVGMRPTTVTDVVVRADAETALDLTMTRAPITLAGVVVSASRRAEKITEAPATVTRIEASEIENTVGNSFAPALKTAKGLDYVQIGMTSVAVNARGFNSAFNNRMLMLEDSKIAVLPESGLPIGGLTIVPKVDLASVEVLVGPGSALYGPDASNGVITLSTKDPREYPGTTLEATGGSRTYYDVQGRQAGVVGGGRFGYKIAGEYQAANDWENHNVYAPINATAAPSQEQNADFNTNVARGEGALIYYLPGTGGQLDLSGGLSNLNGIGLTNVGRNQLVDYKYGNGQLRYTNRNWFAQAYQVETRSGDTYQLNGYAQNRLRYPTISDDSVRKLSAFPGEGHLSAAELQNTFALGMLNDMRITWGGQFRQDRVSSHRRWLSDRKTGEDVKIAQRGVYAQVDAPLTRWLKAVAAARYDKHEFYDAQWSPKAGLLFSPVSDQTVRVTFNRAFKSPSILQTSFFFPDFQPFVGVFGNKNGFVVKDASGNVVRTIDPIRPETNDTWELGYKGVLAGKLYLDATGYYSNFDRFMSPLVIFANPLSPTAPTTAYDAKTGEKITGATGGPQIPLTYFNVGRAIIHGTDIGLRYLVTPTIGLTGTTSLQKLDRIERRSATDPAEATAFNSTTSKFTVGMDFAELATKALSAGWTARYVNGYDFLSGVNVGRIPTFSTFDFTLGYGLPQLNSRVNLSVQNLFSCTGGTTAPNLYISSGRRAIYTKEQKCGFGHKHAEMLNSPELGTMVFLGVRYQR